MNSRRAKKLECLVREGERPGYNVVLLHGYGADRSDLFPLAEVLDPEHQWTFHFPNAPNEVPIGPGWTGRGWFPISLRDLEVGVDFTQIRPPGMDESADAINQLLFDLESEHLVIGGFSQGAMLATEVALSQPEHLKGLVVYSGVMLDQPNWTKRRANLKDVRILQSHGTRDQVLHYKFGEQLYHWFRQGELNVEWLPFPGAHEIPYPVVRKTAAFLGEF